MYLCQISKLWYLTSLDSNQQQTELLIYFVAKENLVRNTQLLSIKLRCVRNFLNVLNGKVYCKNSFKLYFHEKKHGKYSGLILPLFLKLSFLNTIFKITHI